MRETRPRRLQLFGERCSGTNYVAELLRRNVGLRATDEFGWKHGWPQGVIGPAADCVFAIVVRDPFDWVRSLHRQPWHAAAPLRDRPLAQFLREPWWCEWGRDMTLAAHDARRGTEMMHERDPATGERFANVMRLRTAKLRAWLALEQRVQHVAVVRYEHAAGEPRRFVREFAQRFGLRRWPWLRAVRTFKGGPDPFVKRELAAMAAADVEWVARELDEALERRCGYDIAARAAALLAAGQWASAAAVCCRAEDRP